MKLTPKQQAFCDYYIETANATEAARRAGYKGRNLNRVASENLSKLDIHSYIAERMAEKESERIASQNEVLQFLTSVMRGEVTEEVPMVMKSGFEVVDKHPSVFERIKAAEQLGKRYALWDGDGQKALTEKRLELLDLEKRKLENPMGEDQEDDGFMDALRSEATSVWEDDEDGNIDESSEES